MRHTAAILITLALLLLPTPVQGDQQGNSREERIFRAATGRLLPPLVVDTDVFRVTFSNEGATVRSWILKKYRGEDGRPLDVINTASEIAQPFSFYFMGRKPAIDVNSAYYEQGYDPDGLGISYQLISGHITIRNVGLMDQHFLAIFLPAQPIVEDCLVFSDPVRTAVDLKPSPYLGVAVPGDLGRFTLFVGPKDRLVKRV